MCVGSFIFRMSDVRNDERLHGGQREREGQTPKKSANLCVTAFPVPSCVCRLNAFIWSKFDGVAATKQTKHLHFITIFVELPSSRFFCPLFLMKLPAINDTQYACEAHWRQAKRGAPMRIIDYYSIIISLQTHNIVTILPYSPLCRVA